MIMDATESLRWNGYALKTEVVQITTWSKGPIKDVNFKRKLLKTLRKY